MNIGLKLVKLPKLVTLRRLYTISILKKVDPKFGRVFLQCLKKYKAYSVPKETWSRYLFLLKSRSQLFNWVFNTPLILQKVLLSRA